MIYLFIFLIAAAAGAAVSEYQIRQKEKGDRDG